MQRSYIGLQGVAAGPIKIGPQGPWLVGSTFTTAENPNRKVLEIRDSIQGETLLSMRAGYPSSVDDCAVVTIKYLKEHYVSADGTSPTIDLSDYVTYTSLNDVKTQLGNVQTTADNAWAQTQSNLIKLNELAQELAGTKSLAYDNQQSISTLTARFDNLTFDPFGGPVLLVAGNARGES